MDDIINFYNTVNEELRFLKNSRKIEFITSNNVLNQYLCDKSYILDIGAGTGAYSFYYAQKGHRVQALDLTPKNIEFINQKKKENIELQLEANVGNATDLSDFADNTFDAVLCFGPIYHLINEKDRITCILEALRVLKPGGLLAVAYINKYSVLPMLVKKDSKFVRESVVQKVI